MNGKERILKTLKHEKVDRVPWVPFAGVHAGSLIGKNATEMLTDGQALFDGLMQVHKLYQPDGMPVIFDLQVEAASCTGPSSPLPLSRRTRWPIPRTCSVTANSLLLTKAACR